MSVLELWLVRHGETMWNRERRIQGDSDIPLNDLGREQARRLALRLKGMTFDEVHASDLCRASETAQLALPGAEVLLDRRLREIHLGQFEGRVWTELSDEEKPQLVCWWQGPYSQKVLGGESSDDLRARVQDWILSLPKSGRVIAFAHGGTIASILQTVVGRPEPSVWSFILDNTSISKLLIGADFTTVKTVNDAAHLESWPCQD